MEKNGAERELLEEARQGEALVLEGTGTGKKLYMESYGCQMNFSDSEIVASILQKEGYETTTSIEEADLVLLNTCSIREKAQENIKQPVVIGQKTMIITPTQAVESLIGSQFTLQPHQMTANKRKSSNQKSQSGISSDLHHFRLK